MWVSFDDTNWTLLGVRSEDLSINLNPNVEQGQDVTGASYTDHNGFSPNLSYNYMPREDDSIYPQVQKIVDGLVMEEAETKFSMIVATLDIEVKDATGSKSASGKGYKVDVICVPTNDGGPTAGYTTEVTFYEDGARVQGSVTVSNRKPTFSEGSTL